MRPARIVVGVVASVTLTALLAAVLLSSDPSAWKLGLVTIALGVPGAACVWVQPRNAAGWLLAAAGMTFALLTLLAQLGPGSGGWAAWVTQRSGALVVPMTLAALLLLPDGRWPSARWRPVVAGVVTAQLATVVLWSLVRGPPGQPNPVWALPASWAGSVETVGAWVLQAAFVLVLPAALVRLRSRDQRSRLVPALLGAVAFAVLAMAGRLVWSAGADALDVLGAVLLGGGLALALLRGATREEPPGHVAPVTRTRARARDRARDRDRDRGERP